MQYILTPQLAGAYIQAVTGNYIREQFKLMMDDIKLMKFTRMDTMHHLLSGFKAVFTTEATLCIDKCRLSTGGAGFASHSGFA